MATEHAPAAVGPYSQGVTANGFIFTAGQVPLDPATGKLVEGDIQVQARQSLTNVQAILEAAGTSMANVVKATVFLADIGDFAAVNEVYAEFFEEPYPARSALEVANLPLGAQVEIEVVATLE
ncbi:MAG: RidA family protein [Chloroflexota bacterium]